YGNRRGESGSIRSLGGWLPPEGGQVARPVKTLWRTLTRRGCVHGASKRRRTLKERDAVIIARRASLRRKRGNRRPAGGPYRPEGELEETDLNVHPSKNPPLVFCSGWTRGAPTLWQRPSPHHGARPDHRWRGSKRSGGVSSQDTHRG